MENHGFDAVRVRAQGRMLGLVEPGSSRCYLMPIEMEFGDLWIQYPHGVRHEVPVSRLDIAPGWLLNIGQTPAIDLQSIRPGPPCR